jgi:hypothetical protein
VEELARRGINLLVGDSETVKGDAISLQLYDAASGAAFFDVTPQTSADTLLRELFRRGDRTKENLLWFHNVEFDIGVLFKDWQESTWHRTSPMLSKNVLGLGLIRLELHRAFNPFHVIYFPDGLCWRLTDSMSYFRMSLAAAGEKLGLIERKREQPLGEEWGERPPTDEERPAFVEYALADVKSLYEMASIILAAHFRYGISASVSTPNMAAKIFKTQYLGSEVGRLKKYRTLRISDSVRTFKKYPASVLRMLSDPSLAWPRPGPMEDRVLELSLLGYRGGKNAIYAAPGVYSGVTEADMVSAYSQALCSLPPLTKGKFAETDRVMPGAAGLYRVTGRIKGKCRYAPLAALDGALIYEGVFDTVATGYELEAARAEIELATVQGVYFIPSADARQPFTPYVEDMFERKRVLGRGDPQRELVKLLVNGLYGKLSQLVPSEEPMLLEPVLKAGELYNPFVAAQVTGYVRAKLHRLEVDCAALHVSTDSVLTQQGEKLSLGSGLGELSMEGKSGRPMKGDLLLLGPRRYALIDPHTGECLKSARHGIHMDEPAFLKWIANGGGPYVAREMVHPKQAARSNGRLKAFAFVEKRYQVPRGIDPEVMRACAEHYNKLQRRTTEAMHHAEEEESRPGRGVVSVTA